MARPSHIPSQQRKKSVDAATDTLFQRGFAHHRQGEIAQAAEIYEQVIKRHPNHFDALHFLGVIAAQQKSYDRAIDLMRRAIKLDNRQATVHANLALALHEKGDYQGAVASFDRALALNPTHAANHSKRGNALQALNDWAGALQSYDYALAIEPRLAEAHTNRGLALAALMRLQEAHQSCQKAIELAPALIDARYNLATVLQKMHRLDEAKLMYEQTLALNPFHVRALMNKGLVLHDQHQFEQALACYDQALRWDTNALEASWNKSLTLLTLGRFEEGWPLYETRWQCGQKDQQRAFEQPLWLGQTSLAGKTILLHAEQGLGDSIQFVRYVDQVAALGATVILQVPNALVNLFASLPGAHRVISQEQVVDAFDYHCPLLSLPLAFGTTLATMANKHPYLCAPTHRAQHFKQRHANDERFKVGLVWSGGYRADRPDFWPINARRNVPLDELAHSLQMPGVRFFSLQKGEPAQSELQGKENEFWPNNQMTNWADELADFTDTAALIDGLDLVISVDTSTAHLAAAQGKPVWLLSRSDACWRWLYDRCDSPWYPTLTLYRQRHDNDWAYVLAQVQKDLIHMIEQHQLSRPA